MKRIFLTASALLLTAACTSPDPVVTRQAKTPTIAQAERIKDGVKEVLKDPFTAQFRHLRIEERSLRSGRSVTVACGQVNSKNSFGAYVGYKTFVGELHPSQFTPYTISANINMFEAKDHCS